MDLAKKYCKFLEERKCLVQYIPDMAHIGCHDDVEATLVIYNSPQDHPSSIILNFNKLSKTLKIEIYKLLVGEDEFDVHRKINKLNQLTSRYTFTFNRAHSSLVCKTKACLPDNQNELHTLVCDTASEVFKLVERVERPEAIKKFLSDFLKKH